MSFSLTPEEQARVDFLAAMNRHLDPIGTGDLVMICVISAVYAIDLLAVIFVLFNRNYPPILSKSPYIMVAGYISSVLWFVGDLQTNGHLHLKGTVLQNCKAFGVWIRLLLGVCTVSSLIALRSYGLFRVFRLNLPYRGLGFYLPFLVYCLCLLVYGIVSQLLPSKSTIFYFEYADLCTYTDAFKASLFAFVWVTWLIVAFINWRIRNIKSSFNESREMAFACLLVFAVLAFTTVMHYVKPEYPLNLTLRLLTTSLDHLTTNVVWWSIMATPIVNCIFRRQEYLQSWTRKLRKDGLQREYQLDSGTLNGGTVISTTPLNRPSADTYNRHKNVDSYYYHPNKDEHHRRLNNMELSIQSPHRSFNSNGSLLVDPLSPITPSTAVASPTFNEPPSNALPPQRGKSLRRKQRELSNASSLQTPQTPVVSSTYSNSSSHQLQSSASDIHLLPYQPINFREPAHITSLRWQDENNRDSAYELPNSRRII